MSRPFHHAISTFENDPPTCLGNLPDCLRAIQHDTQGRSGDSPTAVQFRLSDGTPLLSLRTECSLRAMAVHDAIATGQWDTRLGHSSLTAHEVIYLQRNFTRRLLDTESVVFGRIDPENVFLDDPYTRPFTQIECLPADRTPSYQDWLTMATVAQAEREA